MHTVRSSSCHGGVSTPPWQQTPPVADPPGSRAHLWSRHIPPGSRPPLEQAPPLWTEFLTHACENITLLQTSFAGGKNKASTVWN